MYRNLGISKRKHLKRRHPNPEKQSLLQPLGANLTWNIDFMHDSLESGRKFRTSNVIENTTARL